MRLIERMTLKPWLITEAGFQALLQQIKIEQQGMNPNDLWTVEDGGLAVVDVQGVMVHRPTALEAAFFGLTDTAAIREAVEQLAELDAIKSVVLRVDSPGGEVTGVAELGQAIADCNKHKRVVAYTDSQACSAAYWAASQAWGIIASPSATVGSVGVYLPVVDWSRMYDQAGVRVDMFKGGKFKAAGYPGTELTPEQRAQIQGQIDYLHAQFKAAVNEGRGGRVAADSMEGQTFFGEQAAAIGMVDSTGGWADAKQLALGGTR